MEYNISLSQLITIVSVVVSIYFAVKNWGRNSNSDVTEKAKFEATLSEKLDNISEDTKEIRKEISDVKNRVSELSERVVIVEQSTRSAHQRLDMLSQSTYYGGDSK